MSAIMTLFYLSMYTGAVLKNDNSKTFPNQQALDRLGEKKKKVKVVLYNICKLPTLTLCFIDKKQNKTTTTRNFNMTINNLDVLPSNLLQH